MEGEGGVEQGFWKSMDSQGYRLQLYTDWIACKGRGLLPEKFIHYKGIQSEDFTSIIKEFRSLDPDGSKWGVS